MLRLSQKAQSILEYTLVITLVVTGIILMTRYVVYSVNAHLKSWDDAVGDAVEEPIIKFNDPASLPPPQCACDLNFTTINCGLWNCSGTEVYEHRNCTPIGCPCTAPSCDQCTSSALCCFDTPKGPCNTGGCVNSMPSDHVCGGGPPPTGTTTTTNCIPDPSCGPFQCTGTNPDNASPCGCFAICPGLTTDSPKIVVDSCSASPDCEFTCDAGFANNNGVCEPPGVCPFGQSQCWSVTKRGTYQADTWDKDELCSGDKCDPYWHCWNGVAASPLCASQGCGYSSFCSAVTGYGWDIPSANAAADAQLAGACPHIGKKGMDNIPVGFDCNTSCDIPNSAEKGTTKFLCVSEDAPVYTCVPSSGTCP